MTAADQDELLKDLKKQFEAKSNGLTREQVNQQHIIRLHDYNE
jgi:hypothetical protein